MSLGLQKDLMKLAHQGHKKISETLERKIRLRAFFSKCERNGLSHY